MRASGHRTIVKSAECTRFGQCGYAADYSCPDRQPTALSDGPHVVRLPVTSTSVMLCSRMWSTMLCSRRAGASLSGIASRGCARKGSHMIVGAWVTSCWARHPVSSIADVPLDSKPQTPAHQEQPGHAALLLRRARHEPVHQRVQERVADYLPAHTTHVRTASSVVCQSAHTLAT